jgi:hypothetical protein
LKVRTTEVEHIPFELADENKRRQTANAISPLIGENFDAAPVWDASTVTSVTYLVIWLPLMRESAALTVSALEGGTLLTVPGAAHDIPLSQPGVIASELHRQITEFTP